MSPNHDITFEFHKPIYGANPMQYQVFGKTGISIPPIIFGTSCLGNLFTPLPHDVKLKIIKEMFAHSHGIVVMDSAGKYGAGLALEVIGKGLKKLGIHPENVIISNKLGWLRIPLKSSEPTFEPGVWMGLEHDAIQKISYEGILECWEQGCELLGEDYHAQLLSVHDPDEYLDNAGNERERADRFKQITGAYQALIELKKSNKIQAVGVGAKDWKVIREIIQKIDLDWVMIANSFTIYHHPSELMDFIDELHRNHVGIINSAVFHAGFLAGGKYFDYRVLNPANETDKSIYKWRDSFFTLCDKFNVLPATACVQFALSHPGVQSVALNTSKPDRIKENVAMATAEIPDAFWRKLKNEGLISQDYTWIDKMWNDT